MNDYMTLLHKHKINGGFLAPDRIPMEERNKNEMILELQNEVHTKDKEIERLKNGCEELEQQIDDLHKLETTITNENERLNNIIKVKDKYIDQLETLIVNIGNTNYAFCFEVNRDEYMSKMRELKGSDKE